MSDVGELLQQRRVTEGAYRLGRRGVAAGARFAALVVDLGFPAGGPKGGICGFERARVAELARDVVDLEDAASG
jgi:hypothetical protein